MNAFVNVFSLNVCTDNSCMLLIPFHTKAIFLDFVHEMLCCLNEPAQHLMNKSWKIHLHIMNF